MTCLECDAAIPPDADHCPSCGIELTVCSNSDCGEVIAKNFASCPFCNTPVVCDPQTVKTQKTNASASDELKAVTPYFSERNHKQDTPPNSSIFAQLDQDTLQHILQGMQPSTEDPLAFGKGTVPEPTLPLETAGLENMTLPQIENNLPTSAPDQNMSQVSHEEMENILDGMQTVAFPSAQTFRFPEQPDLREILENQVSAGISSAQDLTEAVSQPQKNLQAGMSAPPSPDVSPPAHLLNTINTGAITQVMFEFQRGKKYVAGRKAYLEFRLTNGPLYLETVSLNILKDGRSVDSQQADCLNGGEILLLDGVEFLPERAGQQQFNITIEGEDRQQNRFRLMSRAIIDVVENPSHQNITINAERDIVGLDFGMMQADMDISGPAFWEPLTLNPDRKWMKLLVDPAVKSIENYLSNFPSPIRPIGPFTRFQTEKGSAIHVFCKPVLVIGRNSKLSDWSPRYFPGSNYRDHQALLRISKKHCQIALVNGHAKLTDLSTHGVSVNGRNMKRGKPIDLEDGDSVNLAGAMEFEVHVHQDSKGSAAVELRRSDGIRQSYVLIQRWVNLSGPLGAEEKCPQIIAFPNADGKLLLGEVTERPDGRNPVTVAGNDFVELPVSKVVLETVVSVNCPQCGATNVPLPDAFKCNQCGADID